MLELIDFVLKKKKKEKEKKIFLDVSLNALCQDNKILRMNKNKCKEKALNNSFINIIICITSVLGFKDYITKWEGIPAPSFQSLNE